MTFLNRPSEFIAVWPGDDNPSPCYGGEVVVLPATDEVAVAGQGRFRFGSAKDRNGNLIPGTVQLRDITRVNDKGAVEKVFDAAVWCEGIYDLNKKLLERGFSVVTSVDEIDAAKAAGRPKWIKARVQEMDALVRKEQERRATYKAKGQEPPMLSIEDNERIMRAAAELRAIRAEEASKQASDSDLADAIGVSVAPSRPVAVPVVAPKAADGDFEMEAFRDLLWTEAKEHGVKLNAGDKEGLLDLDPSVIQAVNEKVSAAKKAKAQPVAVGA